MMIIKHVQVYNSNVSNVPPSVPPAFRAQRMGNAKPEGHYSWAYAVKGVKAT